MVEQAIDEWAGQFPEMAEAIRAAAPDASTIQSKFDFQFVVYRVSGADGDAEEEIRRAPGRVLEEVAEYARSALQSFRGREKVRGTARKRLQKLRDRLDALGFLDGSFAPIVEAMDDVLATMPSQGPIQGLAMWKLLALLQALTDPLAASERVRQLSDMIVEVQNSQAETGEAEVPEQPGQGDGAEAGEAEASEEPGQGDGSEAEEAQAPERVLEDMYF